MPTTPHSTPTANELATGRSRRKSIGLGLAGVATGALIAFHSLLFAERLRDLSILKPSVAIQWVGTAVLLALLAYLKKQFVPLLTGRTAIAFWLLVLLLHLVPAAAAAPPGSGMDLLLAMPLAWLATGLVILATYLLHRGDQPVADQTDVRRLRNRRAPPLADPLFAADLYARPPPPLHLH